MSDGWIGVDLDGTLAEYSGWGRSTDIGDPIEKMVARVKAWLAEGQEVRIFTARVSEINAGERDAICEAIDQWCLQHIGQMLPITCTKDHEMTELWDDRAVQVIPNTGKRADGKEEHE